MIDAIPRRSAVYDREYDHDLGVRLLIFLDGVKQEKVISYDIDAGEVERYGTDAEGNISLNQAGDAITVERVNGIVTAEWRD